MTVEEQYMELDEISNLVDNVEMIARFLESPLPHRWKWVAIALHGALYSALICALRGSDARQTVADRRGDQGKALIAPREPRGRRDYLRLIRSR